MNIKLKIQNGKRKGSTIVLHKLDGHQNTAPFIFEDEAIIITFSSEVEYEKVSIQLHENEVEYTNCFFNSETESWEYSWIPKKLYYQSYECFFNNYFGIAELYLYLTDKSGEEIIPVEKIDVLAKKINAERVDEMLSFLAKHNSEALCAFFRVTRRNAGFKNGDTPADIFLEWIDNNTKRLQNLVDGVLGEPITKLTSSFKLIAPSDSLNIDDQTLAWLCDNLEDLYETDDERSAIINYDDKLYTTNKIRENVLSNDTDVYENQVIHGFISTLKLAVSGLLVGYEAEPPYKKPEYNNDEYFSFYNQVQKFQKKINSKKIQKCNEIFYLLGLVQKKLIKRIPVKRHMVGLPSLTMKVKKNRSYLAIFNKIINWYRFGSPDWSMQEELLSIKSIPKLFEYYSLFYIKEQAEMTIKSSCAIIQHNDSLAFRYPITNGSITLHYEPKYWMPFNKKSEKEDLLNSENWTVNYKDLTLRGHHGVNSNRSPDFVFTIKYDNKTYHYIMDAKYTYPHKAFVRYLPELTLKYLHGLHNHEGENTILGLTIICPNEECEVKHFHSNNFNIISAKPILPSLSVAAIKPGGEFSHNAQFEHVINAIIGLLLSKVNVPLSLDALRKSA